MNIFCDRHHGGLANSLVMLFHNRLKHEIYFPIGMEWAQMGYWKVYNHPDTQKQYLMDGYIPKDGTPPLNGISRIENGIHILKDEAHHSEQKAITFEQFKSMDIDIVIASIPQHIQPFKELISKYKPKAKFIFQMGNMFDQVINNLHEIPNLLSSTIDIPVPSTCNAVFYHQEFDTSLLEPTGLRPNKQIVSFINLLPQTRWASDYYMLKSELPEYEFKSHGILTDDGTISGVDKIANIMKHSAFGFHAKYMGDGYGHVLFSWFCAGKPVITRISDYRDKLGGELLSDGVTCFDLDSYSVQEVAKRIREITPTVYEYMCQQARNRFKEKVDFEAEAGEIKLFIDNLI